MKLSLLAVICQVPNIDFFFFQGVIMICWSYTVDIRQKNVKYKDLASEILCFSDYFLLSQKISLTLINKVECDWKWVYIQTFLSQVLKSFQKSLLAFCLANIAFLQKKWNGLYLDAAFKINCYVKNVTLCNLVSFGCSLL